MNMKFESLIKLRFRMVLLLLCSALMLVVPLQAQNKKPNIIFIVADDLGWQDVGFMGSQWFETPNLDRLAKESLVFSDAYMYPTCSPSRTALLTGKQSFRTGVYTVPVLERGNNQDNIFSRWTVGTEHPVYAEPLNKAGYKLIHLGKWHIVGPNPEEELEYPFEQKLKQPANGDTSWVANHKLNYKQYYPTGRGFHENVGGSWWGDPARGYQDGYKSESGGYKAPFKNPFIEDKEDDEWLTDRLTNEAIDFIKKNKNEPFFVNLHYYAPHRPTVPRNSKWLQKFMAKAPDTVTGQGSKRLEEIAGYATMIASIDENVQRIIDFLDKEGMRENTILIFTSDNGFNGLQSNTNALRGAKGTVYEGGIRVPAFVNWKGRIVPGSSEIPICGMDYFPTFLELANIRDYKGILDGRSLVPIFTGHEIEERPLFWHLASAYKNPPCSIIRKGKWKLIQFLNDEKLELYNLENDLKESSNLVEERKQLTESLLEELIEWRKKNKAPLPSASSLKF
ncbi:sulfatase [Flammeovirgaceae bacterium SG7u.111]|nr:sulfatase [Flammeovirgaceae bacterium SG7u.132]WPO37937.1 sulfatase [Flammeovirgaceae bacterium SG7u.111]